MPQNSYAKWHYAKWGMPNDIMRNFFMQLKAIPFKTTKRILMRFFDRYRVRILIDSDI
jgi:hypothetical protein